MFAKLGRELLRGARQLLYPAVCETCHRAIPEAVGRFCQSCTTVLTTDVHRTCPRCSSPVGEFAQLDGDCPVCRRESYAFDEAFRLGPYEGVLQEAILKVKFGHDESLAEALGDLWGAQERIRSRCCAAQVVIPIPLHWWRRLRRGFNQAELLAESFAARLGVPCHSGWLRRVRATSPQTSLSPTARRENLRGAFRLNDRANVKASCVLLIDDVLTTGSTAHEAARVLKAGGAARVLVGVLAHR